MNSFKKNNICNICGHDQFTHMGTRKDKFNVLECNHCHMGILEFFPEDPMFFYDDYYYQGHDGNVDASYADYEQMAIHGLFWVYSFLDITKKTGKILDIGCANGYLLNLLGHQYEKFGIEVNLLASQQASSKGIQIIGSDLLDVNLAESYKNSFDIITSIAVFEHLNDFRVGVEHAIKMLNSDGILLFEVPLISQNNDNAVWFNSSLEHLFYPTEKAINHLFGQIPNVFFFGTEVVVKDYGSTFIGFASKSKNTVDHFSKSYKKIYDADIDSASLELLSNDEKVARITFQLIHNAQTSTVNLKHIDLLFKKYPSQDFLKRCLSLWSQDVARYEAISVYLKNTFTELSYAQLQLNQANIEKENAINTHRHLQIEFEKKCIDYENTLINKNCELDDTQKQLNNIQEKINALEKEKIAHDKTVLQLEKILIDLDKAHVDRDIVCVELEKVYVERDKAFMERDKAFIERDKAFMERDKAFIERDSEVVERNTLLKKITELQTLLETSHAEIEKIKTECDKTFMERDSEVVERNTLLKEITELQTHLETSYAEIEKIKNERDKISNQLDERVEELYYIYRTLGWRFTKHLWLKLELLIDKRNKCFAWLLRNSKLRFVWIGTKLLLKGEINFLTTILKSKFSDLINQKSKKNELLTLKPSPLTNSEQLVSVVIPCFNYGKFVLFAIESILNQTIKNVEVIVVDGGSTDTATLEVLKQIHHPNVKVFFREGRHYVGDNRNFGIEKANGRYICCLDADDTLDPTYLEKSLFYLETYAYDIVSCSLQFVGSKTGEWHVKNYVDLHDIINANEILTCAVFRKSLWQAVGGYYDSGVGIDHVAEDWDFWIKCLIKGARVRNIHLECLFNYRVHQNGSLSNNQHVMSLSAQREVILNRHKALLTSTAFYKSKLEQSKNIIFDPKSSNLSGSDFNRHSVAKCLFIVMPFLIVGGVERLFSEFSKYLVSKGWRVVIISTNEQDVQLTTSKDWFLSATNEIYQLPKFLKIEEYPDFFQHLIISRSPDCILNLGSSFLYEYSDNLLANHSNIALIDWLFNTVGHVDNHIKFKQNFTRVFSENLEVFEWLINKAGWHESKIKLLHSGVDIKKLTPTSRVKEITDKLNIDENDLIVGFSGRLSIEKSPDLFIEVAALCNDKNLHFVMTGDGPLESEIKEKISKLDDQVKFSFLGTIDDIFACIASYDLLILPSRIDGRPLVVLEAMALGVPVIASKVGALPDIITDKENGFLIDTFDPLDFAKTIHFIEKNRNLLASMKQNARKYAEDNLDSEKCFAKFEEAIKEAIFK